jgi:hypothetical protein
LHQGLMPGRKRAQTRGEIRNRLGLSRTRQDDRSERHQLLPRQRRAVAQRADRAHVGAHALHGRRLGLYLTAKPSNSGRRQRRGADHQGSDDRGAT